MKKIICILCICTVFGKLPNDVRWVVNSSEFKSICHQTYALAISKLQLFDGDKKNTAIIMDLDETVLDNSQYQIELFNKNETFNMESWAAWVLREEANLVPGAKEYIDLVREKGLQLIFISNRMHERLEATKNNLKNLGIFSENDIYLLRLDRADKKYIRRDEVYNGTGRMKQFGQYEVLQYLGDAMGDFPNDDAKRFGKDQFVFPNPMYGKW